MCSAGIAVLRRLNATAVTVGFSRTPGVRITRRMPAPSKLCDSYSLLFANVAAIRGLFNT